MKYQIKKRIHICYSDRHYNPFSKTSDTFWFSCSQIAKSFWESLNTAQFQLTFGDEVPDEPIDLLWTNRINVWKPNVKRMVFFASVAHYSFLNQKLNRIKKKHRTSGDIEGIRNLSLRWKQAMTIGRSNAIAIIGNQTILNTFIDFTTPYRDRFYLLPCGVDDKHYSSTEIKSNVFVYTVTRTSLRKGSHLVSKAWEAFASDNPSAKLIVLGRDGDYDLRDSLSEYSNVEYLGAYTSGSPQYIAQLGRAKWVVLPSLAEGQAGTLLEAMSCGCVPICSPETGVDAQLYGGYVCDSSKGKSLSIAMQNAWNDWSIEQSEHVIERVKQINSWEEFRDSILKMTECILKQPTHVADKTRVILKNFIVHDLFAIKKIYREHWVKWGG